MKMKRTKPPAAKENLQSIFYELEQLHRLREDFIKSRIMVSNQVKAIQRRTKNLEIKPDEYLEEITNSGIFNPAEKSYTKKMEKLAKQLPLHDWYCSNVGCSTLGYASLMAETGDLRNYANPAKVWKRMGLAVHDGMADKNRTKGVNTGYSKRRRMIAYRISSAIVKTKGEYRDLYDQRKQYEIDRDEAGGNKEYVEKNKAFMIKTYASPENKKRILNGQLPKCVIDLRAQRYIIKRLIKNLWIEWNKLK
jgi:hypothetical protein